MMNNIVALEIVQAGSAGKTILYLLTIESGVASQKVGL